MIELLLLSLLLSAEPPRRCSSGLGAGNVQDLVDAIRRDAMEFERALTREQQRIERECRDLERRP